MCEIITDARKLRFHCRSVLDKEIEEISEKLIKVCKKYNGIGLAAPQIGIYKQIAVVRDFLSKEDKNIILINPSIVSQFSPITFYESCLSFPGQTIKTKRYSVIRYESNKKRYDAYGITAIAIQHEIDHLLGILMFDRREIV